jgi:hypothetical protein
VSKRNPAPVPRAHRPFGEGSREHCKSFRNKTLADGFLDGLKDAARDRRPFSPRGGLTPAASARLLRDMARD